MKFKFILIAALILAIISIGAVSATDTISEDIAIDDALEIGETNLYTTDETGSFSDLQSDINNCSGNVLDIQRNYRFNNETDAIGGINITRDNFVINGNGFAIDGNNQSGIFTINGTNIIINNLTFINANSNRGSVLNIMTNCSVTTNDVVFENNTANIGVIWVFGQYISNNDKIIDSTSSDYGVVLVYNGAVASFNNALMMSSKQLAWGFIYAVENGILFVSNSTFTNTTSKYSTAIFGNKVTIIENSKFINLHANVTAGAIAVKGSHENIIEQVIINNCAFINVTSEKNAGAILADVYNNMTYPPVSIVDSTFVDCYSGFGGAIMEYGGNLTIDNCYFTNNSALFDGGALYTSYASVTITNSTFTENYAQYEGTDRGTYGGTIFCDYGGFDLIDSILTDSRAGFGAIYLYNHNYYIAGNTFYNNLNLNDDYSDIETAFDGWVTILEDNDYSGDGSCSLNNKRYESIINATGMKLILINNTIDVTTLPSRFDLREWGWVTPVRNQGHMGSCWAFGSSGAIESAILRFLGLEIDVSENNMQDVSLQYYMYGTKTMVEGGSQLAGVNYALSWFGVFSSELDTYDELGKISPVIASNNSIHFQDVVYIPPRQNATDNNLLKEALLKYGALAVSYYAAQLPPYYNPETGAQYCDVFLGMNHCVTLVGWDDSYSASNFLITPPGDGAWIFKNSWGESAGIDGYFYISYYDPSFATTLPTVAFLLENTVEYNKNYQYDIGGGLDYLNSSNEYVNFFRAVEDDFIAGVGTYFKDEGTDYIVEVYVNGDLKHNQTGVSPFAGFHTIQLDSFIPIKQGDIFAVKITSNAVPIIVSSRQQYIQGTSQYLLNGDWVNASDKEEVCSIKVYTVDEIEPKQNTTLVAAYYSASNLLVATLTDDEADVIADADVVFDIEGVNYTVKTNSAGQAKIITKELDPGTYTVNVYYNDNCRYGPSNTSIDFSVKADTSISTVYSANQLIATLINNITGQPIKGANVRFILNDEKYVGKTDANGQTILIIEDLAPGTYNATVFYNGNSKYNPSSTTADIVINKISTSISAVYNEESNEFVATLINIDTGKAISGANVVVNVNGVKTSYKTDKQGQIKLALEDVDSDALSVGFSYGGNSKYLKSTTTVKIVENKTTTSLSTVYDKQSNEVVATLTNTATGKVITGANIVFNLNGVKTAVKTNKQGQAIISVEELDSGIYSVGSSYGGNSKYAGSTTSINIAKN